MDKTQVKTGLHILLITLMLIQSTVSLYTDIYTSMRCYYGERGSLTSTCVNATPAYFKHTSYRFDHLDETLKCINCTLTIISASTFDISGNHIKHLDLRNSQIETLRIGSFVGLIFMEDLDLSNNKIKGLYPETFTGIKKLLKANLSYNDISLIAPNAFLELVNLKQLILSNNKLLSLVANTFNGFKNLNTLDISYNLIKDIKDEVFSLNTSVSALNLANNEIESLGGYEFFNATSLLGIDLHKNKLKAFAIYLTPQNHLKELYLSENKISTLAPGTLLELHELETLDLGQNIIQDIQPKTFQQLFNLHFLNLADNNISIFQTATFSGLPQLQRLNFSNNNIKSVEINGVFPLSNLHSLDLSKNQLRDLDYTALIARLPKLTYLKLDQNTFECNLAKEMEELFSQDNIKFVLDDATDAPTCSNNPTVSKHLDGYVESAQSSNNNNYAEIWLFVLMSIIIICISVLFFLQYRVYIEIYKKPLTSSMSTVHIISSDLESRD